MVFRWAKAAERLVNELVQAVTCFDLLRSLLARRSCAATTTGAATPGSGRRPGARTRGGPRPGHRRGAGARPTSAAGTRGAGTRGAASAGADSSLKLSRWRKGLLCEGRGVCVWSPSGLARPLRHGARLHACDAFGLQEWSELHLMRHERKAVGEHELK